MLLPFVESDKDSLQKNSSCPYNAKTRIVGDARPEVSYHSEVDEVDRLIDNLTRGSNDVVRTHAATDLGQSGDSSTRVLNALSSAMRNDSSKWVRRAAVKSLEKVGGSRAIPYLQQATRDRNKWVAHSAQKALNRLKWRRARLR